MDHLVGYAQNGVAIYVDLISSEAARAIAREPHLLTLAAEALRNIPLQEPAISLAHDMGRVIGYDFVVETTAADNIFYVQLAGDNIYTRFTKNGKPSSTQHLSMVLRQDQSGTIYGLHGIWIGYLVPPKPGSAEETAKSRAYWGTHALVFENQPIQPRTLTKTQPY